MAYPIVTAGTAPSKATSSPRSDAIKLIRAALRKQDATDDEVEVALEALVDLAREPSGTE